MKGTKLVAEYQIGTFSIRPPVPSEPEPVAAPERSRSGFSSGYDYDGLSLRDALPTVGRSPAPKKQRNFDHEVSVRQVPWRGHSLLVRTDRDTGMYGGGTVETVLGWVVTQEGEPGNVKYTYVPLEARERRHARAHLMGATQRRFRRDEKLRIARPPQRPKLRFGETVSLKLVQLATA